MFSMHRRLNDLTAYVAALEERLYRIDGMTIARQANSKGEAFHICDASIFGREKNYSDFQI